MRWLRLALTARNIDPAKGPKFARPHRDRGSPRKCCSASGWRAAASASAAARRLRQVAPVAKTRPRSSRGSRIGPLSQRHTRAIPVAGLPSVHWAYPQNTRTRRASALRRGRRIGANLLPMSSAFSTMWFQAFLVEPPNHREGIAAAHRPGKSAASRCDLRARAPRAPRHRDRVGARDRRQPSSPDVRRIKERLQPRLEGLAVAGLVCAARRQCARPDRRSNRTGPNTDVVRPRRRAPRLSARDHPCRQLARGIAQGG